MSQQTAVIQDKSGPVTAYRVVSILSAALFLLQPILAGQFLFNDHGGLKDVHRIVGDILILTVAGQLLAAFLARRTFGIGLIMHNVALLVLTFAQVGLGEAGKEPSGGTSTELALHIPLGVALFGMGLFAPFMGFYDLKAQRRPQ
jgi:hypothetical protein